MAKRKSGERTAEGLPVQAPGADPTLQEQAPSEALVQALTPGGRDVSEEMLAAVQAADDSGDIDLQMITDEELIGRDTMVASRVAYVLSYLNLINFLRTPAKTFAEKAMKAKFSIGYVRHAESNSLEALSIGVRAQDLELQKRADELRQKLKDLATIQAKAEVVE